ncbi:MAG: PstS family phosphate ABC transporter substrate-binding protein [Actinomycetota bacterium]|nr:PstS family phosphate ABC transporter substrate-binding protein [Actinomycetota bacterium]
MNRATTRSVRLLSTVVGLALLAAACGGDDDAGGNGGATGEAPGTRLSGAVVVDGSSTVAPITEAISEEFRSEQPGVDVSVGTSGTGGGFKKFCANEIDIADASRAIRDEEKQACSAAGVQYTEFRVGLDGLAIVTSAQNGFVECLSTDQLATIFKEDGASTWNQVDPKFPSERIAIFAPGTDSGTYDFFVEEVLDPRNLEPRTDYTASEDDNTLVQGIKGERNSWGYFGFAYFQENEEALKDIQVSEQGGRCVAPSDETVRSGDYPLSRPLFIYVKNSSLAQPHVKEFVRFYLEGTPELISDVGYTAAPQAEYEEGLKKLEPTG